VNAIALQFSSAASVSLRFHSRKKILGAFQKFSFNISFFKEN
jgi:hypothetical protein